MTTYFSTFISGTQEIVEEALKKEIIDLKIVLLLDGLVVFQTKKEIEEILRLRFLNNSFLLFKYYKKSFSSNDLVKQVFQQPDIIPVSRPKGFSSFRVIISKENQLTSIDKNLLSKVEALIAQKLHLKVDRTSPDTEVWFLTRNEGYSFIGLRLTKKPNYEKTLHKGELRPEVANIMCLLADLKPSDIVLDPFSGYGSIPLECTNHFKIEKFFAGEKDKKVFEILRDKTKVNKRIVLGKWDGLNLSALTNGSIDKIITDPPWGVYTNENTEISVFYKKMFSEFSRLLKINGEVVVLTAQKELMEKLIKGSSKFKLQNKYDILVSGKKAGIYKILKNYEKKY